MEAQDPYLISRSWRTLMPYTFGDSDQLRRQDNLYAYLLWLGNGTIFQPYNLVLGNISVDGSNEELCHHILQLKEEISTS
ncbi:hypothetical protein DITRI_Ditri08aG0141600 [Diplodiscus trichospermus]